MFDLDVSMFENSEESKWMATGIFFPVAVVWGGGGGGGVTK